MGFYRREDHFCQLFHISCSGNWLPGFNLNCSYEKKEFQDSLFVALDGVIKLPVFCLWLVSTVSIHDKWPGYKYILL